MYSFERSRFMRLFDLHCDTIVELGKRKEDFFQNTTQFSLRDLEKITPYVQTMAIFVPDGMRGEEALEYVDIYSAYLEEMVKKHSDWAETAVSAADISRITAGGKCAIMRSLENGSALGHNLEKVGEYVRRGFRMMTLVWNGENELGSGHATEKGLTGFGRQVIRRMEESGMIVDCSHLNDRGFDELCEIAKKPFIASHSNSRAVCPHKRNLTDGQFLEIVKRKGLVGLNLYRSFIDEAADGSPEGLFRHVWHMLELGGEDVIACGSDFDGANIHKELNTPLKFAGFCDYLSGKGIPDEVIEKIFWGNAMRFYSRNLR